MHVLVIHLQPQYGNSVVGDLCYCSLFLFFPADIAKILQHDYLFPFFLSGGSATSTLACYVTGLSFGHHFKCIKIPFHPQGLFLGTVARACH